ncbi:MAG: hypothetical protein P1U63_08100 [Coxiellaceae bacterium]|nr:hypothetical protein [Coxiellaceae bacterium]
MNYIRLLVVAIMLQISTAVWAEAAAPELAKGNGIILFNQDGDIHCDINNNCTSDFFTALKTNYHMKQEVFYIFPDFAYINQMPGAYGSQHSVNNTCTHRGNYILSYYAVPIIPPQLLNDYSQNSNEAECLSGQEITGLYHQNPPSGKQVKVLPVFRFSDIRDSMNHATTEHVNQLTTHIATVINNDANASGVAIDIEDQTQHIDKQMTLITALVQQLAVTNKLVAIFNPQYLEVNQLTSLSNQYHNLVVILPLYDNQQDSRNLTTPLTIDQYGSNTTEVLRSYFLRYGGKVPMMFALPGAATLSIYEHINVYNKNLRAVLPIPPLESSNCLTQDIDAIPLEQFLATIPSPPNQQITTDHYLSQCSRYANSVTQQEYFSTALSAITSEFNSFVKDHKNSIPDVVGVILYQHQPIGSSALKCAKNIDSDFNRPRQCFGYYPETIKPDIWQALSAWELPVYTPPHTTSPQH